MKMICDICNKELDPLDAHMRRFKGKLTTGHIDCFKKEFLKLGKEFEKRMEYVKSVCGK